jgi:polysaccharide pyruvyl transferase WcaK-like protein
MNAVRPRRRIAVGLLWHTFGQGNLGVDALTRSHAQLLRNAAERADLEIEFTVIGTAQDYTDVELAPDIGRSLVFSLKSIIRDCAKISKTISGLDIVFDIGEGDSFTDIYGTRRYLLQIISKALVLKSKKPLVLAPQTIGPFNNGIKGRLAAAIMRRAHAVFTRDYLSTSVVNALGVESNIEQFTDVAFGLPFQRRQFPPGRTRIGLNVSALLFNNGYTGRNELGMTVDYRKFTETLIEHLQVRPDIEIHLIPHVHGSYDDHGPDNDAPVMRALSTRYDGLIEAPLFRSSERMKGYIAGMDFMVAGRMHACIGAFSSGVPVVPVAYSRKFNGLFGTLGYQHFVDGRADTNDQALQKTLACFEDRVAVAEAVKDGLTKAKLILKRYEDRLVDLLREAVR